MEIGRLSGLLEALSEHLKRHMDEDSRTDEKIDIIHEKVNRLVEKIASHKDRDNTIDGLKAQVADLIALRNQGVGALIASRGFLSAIVFLFTIIGGALGAGFSSWIKGISGGH
jgi:hypothetical protein